MQRYFTSESVSEGHPDKICDQLSDAVLDAIFEKDPNSRVAIECYTTTGLVVVGGEISTNATIDIQTIVRNTLKEIGYTNPKFGIDADSCCILNCIHGQSSDIAQGVIEGKGLHKEMGAGDQGMMFGYACKQTEDYLPLPISLSHQLMRKLAELRKTNVIPYLRPDSKSQVTVEYEDGVPKRVDTVVISTQHNPDVTLDQIKTDIIEKLIKTVIPNQYLDENTKYHVNPTGKFVIGGPQGDTGLTGRKIIVDTYGGWGAHGGGAFSGKDPSKVDRSGAYMARYIAKNIVKAELADEIEIQLAYAIGVAEPVSIHINTVGTAKVEESKIIEIIKDVFDLTPAGIIDTLKLRRPIYKQTATYGHFGRTDLDLSWENCDKVSEIKKVLETKLDLIKK